MPDMEKVRKGLQVHADGCGYRSHHCDAMECPYRYGDESCDIEEMCRDALALLKEQEAVEPKTIPEELKQKMWNALYAAEDEIEKKFVGTNEHDSWFFIFRPWLQKGFNLAIKAIADWEGR